MAPIPDTLLERNGELARILGRLDQACAGSGGLTVIEGPAGIGKTSLLHAVIAGANERGMLALTGRGAALERDFAFGVLRQALERPLAELDAAHRTEVLAGQAAHAAPLFDASQSTASVESLLHGLYWLLANLAEQRPLVLAVDDGHWADESTVRALSYLAGRARQLPLAILLATRPPSLDDDALSALTTDTGTEQLLLAPLTEDAVATLCGRADPAFVSAAVHATGGNPFLVLELLRELGADRTPAAVSRIEPRDLGRSLLARLGEGARSFAWALTILGEHATVAECAALARVAVPLEAVEELMAGGVLAVEAGLRFRHPLIAAAVEAGLPPARLDEWHRRAAALLRDAGADVERVAVHLAAGQPAGSEEVVDVLVRAAERASARGAPSSAVSLLRRALAEPPLAPDRPRVLLALGLALTVEGESAAADAFAEAARTDADPEVIARALEGRAWWWGLASEGVEEELAAVDALIGALPAARDDLHARAEAVRLTIASRSAAAMPEAIARVERLGLLAEGGGQHPDLYAVVSHWRLQTGHPAAACVKDARRAIAAAGPRRGAVLPSIWFPFTVHVLQTGECFADAIALARSFQAAARDGGAPTWYALATQALARVIADTGALADAEAEATAATEAGAIADGWMSALPAGTLAHVLLARGRVADADRTLARVGLPKAIPDERPMDHLLIVRARLRHAQGRHDEARTDLREAMRRSRARGPASMNDQPARLLSALVERARGDQATARAQAAEAVAIAERWGTAGAIGQALHTQGVIDADADLLHAAVDRLAQSPLRAVHATALADLGALLRRRRSRRDAREPLLAALNLARDCGANGLAGRAAEELQASGITVPARPSSGGDALTPSERRIARLAADGATNKVIAQELFLSVKTIEMHLHNAYRKLDISSRRELAAALAPAQHGSRRP